ncbi:MAG: sporulation integral membrane protein YtvI [Leptotrichiaceae bacterium]|mgnify:FL=1|nr:sporulation integral membrane protein YtvI [Leptotrichiaceae bacterium]
MLNRRFNIQSIRKFYFVLYIATTLIVVFLLFKLGIFLFPFVLAFIFSMITQPIARFINKKTHLSAKVSTIISIVAFFLVLFGLMSVVSIKFIEEIYNLSKNLRGSSAQFNELWNKSLDQGFVYIDYLPKEFITQIQSYTGEFINFAARSATTFVNQTIRFITSIPTLIIYTSITILSTLLMSLDKNDIVKFLEHQFPISWLNKIYNIKRDILSVFGSYLRAQLILVTICFFELLIALNLFLSLGLNVKYPLIFSIVISLIDALPILGAGAILIPWSIFSFITGDIKLGFAIFILYVIVLAVRQLLEPKLISQKIGVHPLVTLVSMYSGFKLLGIVGFLIGPIVMIILKNVFSKELDNGFFREMFEDTTQIKPSANEPDDTKNDKLYKEFIEDKKV